MNDIFPKDIFSASITIPTQYFDKTLSFYRDILGFKVLHQIESRATISARNLTLTIDSIDPSSEFFPTGHGMYINLHVHNISQIKERLSAAGIAIQSREYAFLLADPNGNLIDLMGIDADEKITRKELSTLIISAVVSYIRPLKLDMKQLDGYLAVIGISNALRLEMESLQARLNEMIETGQALHYEPSGIEDQQDHLEKIKALRDELFAIIPRFYQFIDAVGQLKPKIYVHEIDELLARMKQILDEAPSMPEFPNFDV